MRGSEKELSVTEGACSELRRIPVLEQEGGFAGTVSHVALFPKELSLQDLSEWLNSFFPGRLQRTGLQIHFTFLLLLQTGNR